MRILLLAAIMLITTQVSLAQNARVKRYTTPLAGTAVLKDVEDKYNANVYSMEAPDVEGDSDMEKLRKIKEQIEKQYPHRQNNIQKKTTAAPAPPTVAISFVADSLSSIPPDNYSAVSKGNKAVTVMNETITIHNASTGAYLMRKSLKSFSAAVGLGNMFNDYRFDPKVMYDPEADRFICIMLNGVNQYNYIVIGFSKTNDPALGWNFYKFYGDYGADTTWFDYPALNITKDELFFTGNKIKYATSWQTGFRQTLIYQIRKQDGYDSATLNYQIWDSIQYNGKPIRCLHPLKGGDGLLGPEQYFLSNRNFDITNDTVFLVKVPDIIGGSTALTITPMISSIPYGVPPDGRQPDTSATLATNDGRVLGGFIQGTEIQFVSVSLNPANGAAALYHGVVSNFNTTPALTGRMFSIDTLDFGYPNISYAGNYTGSNNSIISFEYSGPKRYPGYGAILFDGTSFSDMLTIKSGDSSIKMLGQKQQRWGDYSGSQPDFNAIGTVWVKGIYGRKDKKYGLYMAQLVSPWFTGVNDLQSLKKTVSNTYPVPAVQDVNFDFTLEKAQVLSFIIYDAQGKVVDKILEKYCAEGRNTIRFNIANLAPGTYFLKAKSDTGMMPVHSFIRQ
jgi:hypothetical protein